METQIEGVEVKVKRRRRSGQEIEEWIERYRQSGQNARVFAARHGLRVGTLRQWLYRRGNKARASGQAMVPVKLIDPPENQPAVTLRLPGGVQVEFSAPVEVSVLRELIAAGT